MKWRRARDEQPETPDEWGAELFDVTLGPREDDAAARREARNELRVDAEDLYGEETQAFIYLLAATVARLGGAVSFSREERAVRYSLAIDQSELDGGRGPLRLFSVLQEAE